MSKRKKNSLLSSFCHKFFLGEVLFISTLMSCLPSISEKKGAFLFEDSNSFSTQQNSRTTLASKELSLKAFGETVYPLVRGKTCVHCHGASQSPQFALEDKEQAWKNLTSSNKVDLSDPVNSRIVLKILNESHNCWSGDCASDATTMLKAIQQWASALGENTQEVGNFTTSEKPFPTEAELPQTEYGRVLIQAEQIDPSVLTGRFESFIDSSALGQSYIAGPFPSENPITSSTRQGIISLKDCTLPTETQLSSEKNGPYKIRESSTHVESRTRVVPGTTEYVKDGHTPFTYKIIGQLIRPDKRIHFAKALLAGTLDDISIRDFLLLDGGFQKIVKRPNLLAPSLQGNPISYDVTRILPHLVEYEDIFDNNGQFLNGTHTFLKDDGSKESLYKLFSEGSYEPDPSKLLSLLKNKEELKRNISYYKLKETVNGIFKENKKEGKIVFSRIKNFSPAHFLSTQEVSIQLSCPDEWEGLSHEPVYKDSLTGPFKNCDPNDETYPGKYEFLVFKASDEVQDLEELTYSNALDKLTLNTAQTAIVKANSSALASGKWFHRIDLFQLYKIDINSKELNKNFSRTYKRGESGSYREDEVFTNDSTKGSEGTLKYTLNLGAKNLNLSGLFTGTSNALDGNLKLENFEETLFPLLRNSRCVDCHSSGSAPRFAQENSSLALQVIEENNFANFKDPGDSFRGRSNGIVHNCRDNNSDDFYLCSNDEALKNSIITAIKEWKSKNEEDLSGDGVTSLSKKQRTPGHASYKFKVTSEGDFNIWFRLKSPTTRTKSFDYQIKDAQGRSLSNFTVNENQEAQSTGRKCENFSYKNTSWKWSTAGRDEELESLDFIGNRIYDEKRNVIDVKDSRLYWHLPVGEYSLEIYERTPQSQIDLFALNRVDDFSDDGRLNFQPDLLASDEKYISSYKRHILKYDLSSLLPLEAGESAFFEIEVRREFNDQNYIFKGPRFSFTSNNKKRKLHVKSIRGLINGKHKFTDSTYSNIDYILGLGRVITYAPLVSLIPNPDHYESDAFSFSFENLEIVEADEYTDLNPKGESATISEGRECLELPLFINTVKPLLKYARVVLTKNYNSLLKSFPGTPSSVQARFSVYRCMTCHDEDHPYFKMTTFDFNDNILCKQAISRVDFDNYYQSTIIRGINGTNNHPQFLFLEEFQMNEDKTQWKSHDKEDDYLKGFSVNRDSGLQIQYINGPLALYSASELGFSSSQRYSSLSEAARERAKLIGTFKKIKYVRIPTDPKEIGGYNDLLHYDLLGTIRGEKDQIDPNHRPELGNNNENEDEDPLVLNRNEAGKAMYLHPHSAIYADSPEGYSNEGGVLNDLVLLYSQDSKGFRTDTLDYRGDLEGINTREELDSEFERLRTKYREAIIHWIRAEDEAYKAQN